MFAGMKSCIILWLAILLFASNSLGKDFRYLRTEDGLPDGEINSIVQDSSGNMWFATWSGLVKYDGYYFEVFRPVLGDTTSLPEKKIKKLFVDSNTNLWIATSMGLCRYNQNLKTFQSYRFEGISSGGINILYLSELEKHLVVHAVEGLYILPLSKAYEAGKMISRNQVLNKGQSSDEYYYYSLAFNDQLIFVSNSTSQTSSIVFTSLFSTGQKTFLSVEKMVELKERINCIEHCSITNTLYVATTKGVFPFSLDTGEFTGNILFQREDVQKIVYTSNHRLYASVTYPRLLYIDLHTGITGNFESNPYLAGALLDNEILALFEDFSGNLWIGHQGQGISIMDLYRKKFFSFHKEPFREETLNSNTIMCFEGTDNEIFIGCRNNGLNVVSKNELATRFPVFRKLLVKNDNFPGGISDGIWDIEKQSDSVFWMGTDMGLLRLYKKGNTGWQMKSFSEHPDMQVPIRKIFMDSNNNLWCGSHGYGLFLIPNPAHNPDGKFFSFRWENDNPESLSDNVVISIFLDSRKRFWVGTNNGLNQLKGNYENLDLSGLGHPRLQFKRYVAALPGEGLLNNNEINAFFENYNGNLWIATQGGGINILNPETGKFSYLTTADGLPSNDVISLAPGDDGNLWISTTKGLASYYRFAEKPFFRVFNASNGLQGEIFMVNSFYKASDGQLFFGGDNGFTCFYPRDIEINEIKPKISLTDLRVRNRVVEIGDTLYKKQLLTSSLNEIKELTLPFKSNSFSIGISALHFQAPQNNTIAYFLEGSFENWYHIPASNRYVYFTNIPPGIYIFRARTISSDGLFSDEEKSITFEIKPPWYRTGLAMTAAGIFILLITWGFIYILVNRQKLIYQKKIDKITIGNNENRMMFLTNIAHELRTPLSLIIAPVEDLMRNMTVDNQWKNHLHLIFRNSNYLLRLINQIIDFRKLNAGNLVLQPQKSDIVRVVKDVVLNFKGFESQRKISLNLNVPAGSVPVFIDVQKIEEVLYNLISNAFRHTYDNHSITVSLHILENENTGRGKQIQITVFNEGKEIKEEDREKIFDRFYKVDENTEGAGIGLSFAKSLVEMHHGTIAVESFPGRGVSFRVILPFTGIEDAVTEKLKSPVEKEQLYFASENPQLSLAETGNGKPRLLIAEDNKELGEFLVEVLSRNFHCNLATTGEIAWSMIQDQAPALIISDVIMPGMDGLELCKLVKETRETCHIPVLLLTAKNAPEQITEGYANGADAYVTKPFDMNLLISQAARLIQNRELIKEKYRNTNFMVEVDENISTRDEEFIKKVKEILEESISDSEFNVNKLSQQMNISTTQLYRRIKELTGYSPVELIRVLKLQKAYRLLSNKNNTVKEVCYLTGFNNLSYFIKCFREQFGVTPASFRDNGLKNRDKEEAALFP
jgi:signal transduction histidine kinase/ligand-binding sensor domain-containing protein/DNA-binding response OmpR family regulator